MISFVDYGIKRFRARSRTRLGISTFCFNCQRSLHAYPCRDIQNTIFSPVCQALPLCAFSASRSGFLSLV